MAKKKEAAETAKKETKTSPPQPRTTAVETPNKPDPKSKAKEKKDKKEEAPQGLEATLAKLEKDFGKGTVVKLTKDSIVPVETISTGCFELDVALGVGGLPKGRIIEIYGPEASGKTTLTLSAIAQAQKLGGTAAFIDAEHALDPHYARKIGVNVEELLVSQPSSGEEALEITEALVKTNSVDIIVVDSVAALTPQAEIDGDMGQSHMGLQARLMSQACRKLTSSIANSKTIVIFLNQIRHKIGVMFGSPETTTGGNALKFYASVRLDIRRTEIINKGLEAFRANKVKIKVVKNKVAPPFQLAEDITLSYGYGFDFYKGLLNKAVEANIVEKAGTWYSYKEERLGQGAAAASRFLSENKDIAGDILEIFKQNSGLKLSYDATSLPEGIDWNSCLVNIEDQSEAPPAESPNGNN